ncbi:MAG: hypothetical protein HWE22_03410 [Flavobacteriales bacterium]|nr:hypothetical protein [Flavobacteriales bacterium]
MKKILFAVCFLFTFVNESSAQSPLNEWEGEYKGQMSIGYANGHQDSLDVTFELKTIEKDSSWTYKMLYNSARFGEVLKDYEIKRVGVNPASYVLDEKDGTLIDMTYMDGCFYDVFDVMDNYFTSTLCKNGDDLRFDLFMSSKEPSSVTVSDEDEEGKTYEVTSYKPLLHQTVVLEKQIVLTDQEKEANRNAIEAYDKLVDAADEAYVRKKYKKALELYTRAVVLMPSNEYAQRQKIKTEKLLSK